MGKQNVQCSLRSRTRVQSSENSEQRNSGFGKEISAPLVLERNTKSVLSDMTNRRIVKSTTLKKRSSSVPTDEENQQADESSQKHQTKNTRKLSKTLDSTKNVNKKMKLETMEKSVAESKCTRRSLRIATNLSEESDVCKQNLEQSRSVAKEKEVESIKNSSNNDPASPTVSQVDVSDSPTTTQGLKKSVPPKMPKYERPTTRRRSVQNKETIEGSDCQSTDTTSLKNNKTKNKKNDSSSELNSSKESSSSPTSKTEELEAISSKLKSVRLTRSQKLVEPCADEKGATPPNKTKKKSVVKVNKTKERKNTLDSWLETSMPKPGNTSHANGSIEQTTSPKKSARLLRQQTPKSPDATGKITTPKSKTQTFKSPMSITKSKTPNEKKLPVWRTEPKPELLNSAPDDIYGFEYDASECKPKKKRRVRKPRSQDKSQSSKRKVTPKQANLAPTLFDDVEVEVQKPSFEAKTRSKAEPQVSKTEDTVMKDISIERSSTKKVDQSDYERVHSSPPHHSSDGNLGGTSAMDDIQFACDEPCLPDDEKSGQSDFLAGDLEQSTFTKPSNGSGVESGLDNLFGFEEQENTPPCHPIKSTPLKLLEQPTTSVFSSVSPVRKVAKATSRPARLDDYAAQGLILGIRPLPPVKEKRQKQSTIVELMQGMEVDEEEKAEKKPGKKPPPTPQSAFLQPPRRSYSKKDMTAVKRTLLLESDKEESCEEEEEEVVAAKPKKRVGHKNVHKKCKRDVEMEEWCKLMSSHFEDVDKFNLSK